MNSVSFLFLSKFYFEKKEEEYIKKNPKPIKRVLKLISSSGSYLNLIEKNKKKYLLKDTYIGIYIYYIFNSIECKTLN